MYYRGDEFQDLNVVTETPFEYQTGKATYEGAYPGAPGANPGGFLGQLTDSLKMMALFYAPFAPVLAPALMSTPVLGSAISAGSKLAALGGALRPTIEAITTGTGATTTGQGATSGGASPEESQTSPSSQPTSSAVQPLPSEIYYQTAGPSQGLLRSATLEFPYSRPARRASRRKTPRSWAPSARQRKAFLAQVLQALQ